MKLKKFVAAAMAATIVASTSFTTFAMDVTEPASVPVQIDTTSPTSTFKVSIPAELAVDWKQTKNYEIKATATGILADGQSLAVTVDQVDGAAELVHETSADDKIPFEISTVSSSLTGNFKDADALTSTLKFEAEDFSKAPSGRYSKILTYSVTVTE